MKKFVSLCLVVLMVCSTLVFSGCAKTDEQLIAGKWECKLSSELLSGMLKEEMGDEAAFYDFSKLSELLLVLEFGEDMKANAYIDEASAEAFIESFWNLMVEILVKATSEASGTEITADQLFALLETTEEEMKKELMSEADIDDLAEEFTFAKDSAYELIDGKLIIAGEDYGTYKLDGDTLTITDEGVDLVFNRK